MCTKALGELLRPLNPLPWLLMHFCVCLSIDAPPPMAHWDERSSSSQNVELVFLNVLYTKSSSMRLKTTLQFGFDLCFGHKLEDFGCYLMLLCKCKAVEMYQTYGETLRFSIVTISKLILSSSPSKIANACFIFITSLISISWVTYQYCTSMR